MLPLPSSCEGCPFYQYRFSDGNGFVPDVVVPSSKVYILAQNPGVDEVEGRWLVNRQYHGGSHHSDSFKTVTPQPLIDATGQQFNNKYLPLSGLQRDEVSLGNAIRCRPGKALGLAKADDLPNVTATMKLESSKADIVKALKHCRQVHMHIPPSTQVVMTMGRYAMFVMTGIAKDEDEYHKKQSVLESWRGYAVDYHHSWDHVGTVDTSTYHPLQSGKVVMMTMHIAALNYDKKFTHAVLQDFYKLGRLLRKEWPLPLPSWSSFPPDKWPTYSAFDTEYDPSDNYRLDRWSLCSKDDTLYCVEAYDSTTIPIEPGSTVVIQNALADIRHLRDIVDIQSVKVEDMMLAHSVLWPGEPHSLNYINSIYGELNRYKHLSQGDKQLYSAMDAWEPMQSWKKSFIPMFREDRQSWRIYRDYRIPLINIIDKAQQTGARLDSARLSDLQLILKDRLEQYQQRAREITGDPSFNLGGSKRLKEVLYSAD